jgi:hypothetical protein
VGEGAGERGWKVSDQKDDEYLKELAAKGMTVDKSSETLKRELKAIGDRMAADWAAPGRPGGPGRPRRLPQVGRGSGVHARTLDRFYEG